MENKTNLEVENFKEFPSDLFENYDIVALAESRHGDHDDTILKFLDKFIDEINGIFIELPIDYQHSIDNYLLKGMVDEALEGFFNGAEKEGKNIRGLLNILDKIKTAGKPVICFDSSKIPTGDYNIPASYGKYFLKGKSRDEDMFNVLNDYNKTKPGKYLLIGGLNHFQLGKHPNSGDITLGQRLCDAFSDRYKDLIMN